MDGQVLNSSQANYVDDYWDEEQLLLHYHFFGEAGHPQHGNPQFPIDEALARQLQEGDWDSPVDEALARQLQELDGVWDGTDDDALALQLLEMQNSLGTMSLSRPRRTATRPEKTLHGSSSSSVYHLSWLLQQLSPTVVFGQTMSLVRQLLCIVLAYIQVICIF
ncbi:unnamed protein product [Linum tenue]|uniref:Uncharacterized protein n=1 Tax=Linum tenue TaxID=586396 RepID=A0AAV0QP22_9ROSI|nr:unnamed protein product [Linum tenue]